METWLTVGEIADIVFDAVESAVTALGSLPPDAQPHERRAAMRADFDARRAGQDHQADEPETTPAERRQQRRRARWGGE